MENKVGEFEISEKAQAHIAELVVQAVGAASVKPREPWLKRNGALAFTLGGAVISVVAMFVNLNNHLQAPHHGQVGNRLQALENKHSLVTERQNADRLLLTSNTTDIKSFRDRVLDDNVSLKILRKDVERLIKVTEENESRQKESEKRLQEQLNKLLQAAGVGNGANNSLGSVRPFAFDNNFLPFANEQARRELARDSLAK